MYQNVHTSLAATISKAWKYQIFIKEGPLSRKRKKTKKDCPKKRDEKKTIEGVNYANNIDFSIINNFIQALVRVAETETKPFKKKKREIKLEQAKKSFFIF